MLIAIGAVAVLVLVLAAFAGLGRFGELPQQAVTDRPKGRVPAGPVTDELLAELRLPVAGTGYRLDQVDAYLRGVAAGTVGPAAGTLFDVARGGYDMQVVDELIERPRVFRTDPRPSSDDESPSLSGDHNAFTRPAGEAPPGADLPDAE